MQQCVALYDLICLHAHQQQTKTVSQQNCNARREPTVYHIANKVNQQK